MFKFVLLMIPTYLHFHGVGGFLYHCINTSGYISILVVPVDAPDGAILIFRFSDLKSRNFCA